MKIEYHPPQVGVKALVAAPLLLGALWLFGMIFKPPTLFRRTYHQPPAKELAGTYKLDRESSSVTKLLTVGAAQQVSITLRENHSAQVTSLPQLDGFGQEVVCSWTSQGEWSLESDVDGVSLVMGVYPSASSAGRDCAKGPFSFGRGSFLLLGHATPYRIWETVGDPDNGDGLIFIREK